MSLTVKKLYCSFILLPDVIQYDHKMMPFMKYLKVNHKAFPVIHELMQEQMFYKLRTAYNKMGIDTKGRFLVRTDLKKGSGYLY